MKTVSFTPDDLKAKWVGKYDQWKFVMNGKGEWVGYYKNIHGIIVCKSDEKGRMCPDIELKTSTELSPSMGVIWYSIGKIFKKK